ncbi:MAG: VOC family protein [Deltaproteobacteria bacterium]|nr:VOC family protein [Deltaproteobacteria bacterium]
MFKKLTPNMMVENVNQTIDFYSKILGFKLVMAVTDNTHEILTEIPKSQTAIYALMKAGDAEMMFQARKSLEEDVPALKDAKGIGGSLTFYFETEDLDGLYVKLKDHVTILKDLHTTWYGTKEFYIQDCNGYILAFAESRK